MVSRSADRLIAARASIARTCLDALPPAQLGAIVLRAEQRRIVARARRTLGEHGGCLIAEDVGRGKTFIALALAELWNSPLIVAPASLRSTWGTAMKRAGVEYSLVSHESLSRGRAPSSPFDALIVDESHHFRNPATTRYSLLADMAASVPIILLSATPLQNRTRDLAAQVALFHGEDAFAIDAERLTRFVIRGDVAADHDMPAVALPEWLPVHADDGDVLAAILELPAPARPFDGGDAGALRMIGLIRAWASSRAALRAMVRARRRVATAIAQGVEAGRTPTRRETRSWQASDDVVQLGFASLLMRQSVNTEALAELRVQLEDDDVASERLRSALSASDDPDTFRIAAIRSLRAGYPAQRIVAFSEFASTVTAFFAAMRSDVGVGMLTARGAHIATGRIPRDELLARFAPIAQGARALAPHQSVTLLLTTDLLSEGVNLQDASVVLHLDLPWNPARLSQRVGRVRRPGGDDVVRSFLLAPPARAEALLAADARLRRKIEQARGVVGASFDVLPTLTPSRLESSANRGLPSNASAAGALVECLERWAGAGLHSAAPQSAVDLSPRELPLPDSVVGASIFAQSCWLAALDDGRLVGELDGRVTESVADLNALARAAEGEPRPLEETEMSCAVASLGKWLSDEQLFDICGVSEQPGPLRRAAADRLAHIVRHARRHEQARMLTLVSRLRGHLAAAVPLGAQRRALRALSHAAEHRELAVDVLISILDELNAAKSGRGILSRSSGVPRAVAMIALGPASSAGSEGTAG